MSLKQVTFDLFLSSVRFHLASYQLVVWLHGKLVQIHEDVSIISYTTSGVALHGRGSSQGLSSSATGLSANGSAIHTVGANAGVLGCLCIAVPRSVELHKTKQWLLK